MSSVKSFHIDTVLIKNNSIRCRVNFYVSAFQTVITWKWEDSVRAVGSWLLHATPHMGSQEGVDVRQGAQALRVGLFKPRSYTGAVYPRRTWETQRFPHVFRRVQECWGCRFVDLIFDLQSKCQTQWGHTLVREPTRYECVCVWGGGYPNVSVQVCACAGQSRPFSDFHSRIAPCCFEVR